MGHYEKQHKEHYQTLDEAIGSPSGYLNKNLVPEGSYIDKPISMTPGYDVTTEELDALNRNLSTLSKSEVETDSFGLGQHELGAKLDAGKVRPGLVLGDFSNALLAVSELGTFGATKYTDHGWRFAKDGVGRYTDAMMRHLLKHNTGEVIDKDTGLTHLAAVAWNILAVLELTISDEKDSHK